MTSTFGLDDVLDAAEKLSADEQAELIAILNRRLAGGELGAGLPNFVRNPPSC